MSKLSEMIREIVEKEGCSLRGLGRAIGVDHASLSRSLTADGNPEARTVEKILDYLGYDLKVVKRKEVNSPKSKPSRSRRNLKKEVV